MAAAPRRSCRTPQALPRPRRWQPLGSVSTGRLRAQAIAHHCRLRVRAYESGTRFSTERKTAKSTGADLVVATPSRLLRLHQARAISLQNVTHVIVDEADDMLLRGFIEPLHDILARCPPSASKVGEGGVQVSFVSATLPGEVREGHAYQLSRAVDRSCFRSPGRRGAASETCPRRDELPSQ